MFKRFINLLFIIAVCCGFAHGGIPAGPAPPVGTFKLGINWSGLENNFPAITSDAEIVYYANRGFKNARLPILWGGNNPTLGGPIGAQPLPYGPLDTTSTYLGAGGYVSAIDHILSVAATNGMKVLLDVHTFGNGPNINAIIQSDSPGGTNWITSRNVAALPVVTLNATIDPGGAATATQLVMPAVSAAGSWSHIDYVTNAVPGQRNYSVYLKGTVGGEVTYVTGVGSDFVWYSTRCVLTTSWQPCNVPVTATSGQNFFSVGTDLRDPAQTSTPAETFYVAWGQITAGSSLRAYSSNQTGNIVQLGSASLPIDALANFWQQLSARYKNNTGLRGYDLINEPVNGFNSTTWFNAAQGAINSIRGNSDTSRIYVEGVNFSGVWNWVSGQGQSFNNANFYQLVDPANNLVSSGHGYLDDDSSGSHFSWANETALPGLSPPGVPTSATIGVTRLTREFIPWLTQHNLIGHHGETAGSNDNIYNGGSDNYASWNTALRNELLADQAAGIEVDIWGAGAGFGPFYAPYPGPISQANQFASDFTSAGVQSTVMVMLEDFTGYTGPQPTAYQITAPVTITPTGDPNAPTVATINRGSVGVATGNFKIYYGGRITTPVHITPKAYLTDGVTDGGGTFTPSIATLSPGDNAIATFTYTPNQAQTFLISAINDAGWVNPHGVGFTTNTDNFSTARNISNIFGLRRLYAPYVGNIVTVQRPSDNVTNTFTLNNVGNLPRQAIQDWCSCRLAPLMTWYDQGPVSANATAANTGQFSNITSPPTLNLQNSLGYPEVTVASGNQMNFFSQSQPSPPTPGFGQQSIIARANAANGNILVSQDIFLDMWRMSIANYDVGPNNGSRTFATTGASLNTWANVAGVYNNLLSSNNLIAYLNGTAHTTTTAPQFNWVPAFNNGNSNMFYFIFGGANYAGSAQEAIVTYDAFSGTVINNFNTSDNTYYSTPLPDSLTDAPPTIVGGGIPATVFVGAALPFSAVTIRDDNTGSPTEVITLTLVGAPGGATLSGSGISGSGPYTIASNTPANVTSTLQAAQLNGIASGQTFNITISATSSLSQTSSTSLPVTVSAYGIETAFIPPAGTFTPIGNFKGYMLGGPDVTGTGSSFFPFNAQIDYMASQGFGMLKLPTTQSNAIQGPAPFQPWVISYVNNIKAVADYAFSKGMYVMIAFYDSASSLVGPNTYDAVGVNPIATNSFADQRSRIASRFKNYPNVLFEMENEPKFQTVNQWFKAQNVGIAAMRLAGFTGTLCISGNGFQHTDNWTSSGNAAQYASFAGDPLNNFNFCFHAYLDSDNSGQGPNGYKAATGKGSTILNDATTWMASQGYQGLLTEFGIGIDPFQPDPVNVMQWLNTAGSQVTGFAVEGPALMAYMKTTAPSQWKGWAEFAGGVEFATLPTAPGPGFANGGYDFNPEPSRAGFGYNSPLTPNTQTINTLIGGL